MEIRRVKCCNTQCSNYVFTRFKISTCVACRKKLAEEHRYRRIELRLKQDPIRQFLYRMPIEDLALYLGQVH